MNWQEIWERKGRRTDLPQGEEEQLKALMAINAWDNELVGVSAESMRDTANSIKQLMELRIDDRVLDIGCGCGLIYYAMDTAPTYLVGVDYSSSAIAVARQILEGEFYCDSAGAFSPKFEFFDKVISIGVFMYFRDLEYTYGVLRKMVDALKPGGSGLIMSIPDLAYRKQREELRRGRMPLEEYKIKYAGLDHLYFDKAWFETSLQNLGCDMQFIDFFSEDYAYNKHQYHIKFIKKY